MLSLMSVHLCLLCVAIPQHILLIATLHRFGYKPDFQAAFFKLLLSLTVHGLLFCLVSVALGISLLFDAHIVFPLFTCSLRYALESAGFAGNVTALAAIALNRFVNIVYHHRTHELWSARTTKIALVLQWSLTSVFALAYFHPNIQISYINDSLDKRAVAPNRTEYNAYMGLVAIQGFICLLVIIVSYFSCLVTMIHHRITNFVASRSYNIERKLFLQGFMLSSFLTVGLIGFCIFHLLGCENCYTLTVIAQYVSYLSLFANVYIGSAMAFEMSKKLRRHAKMLFKGPKVNKVALAPNNVQHA